MDKLAQLKTAEVAGVISGLIDGGYLKLASDQEFEALTDVVAGSISDNWDLNEVLDKTAEVMDYVSKEPAEGVEKTAEEEIHDLLANYGYLCLAKEAEEISEEDFMKEAGWVQEALSKVPKFHTWAADGAKAYGSAAKDAIVTGGKYVGGKAKGALDTLTAADFRKAIAANKVTPKLYNKQELNKRLKDTAKAWAAVGTAGAGTYGANKLRKKENRDAVKDKASQAYNATLKALKG